MKQIGDDLLWTDSEVLAVAQDWTLQVQSTNNLATATNP